MKNILLAIAFIVIVISGSVTAAENDSPLGREALPAAKLESVLDAVSRNSDKKFAVDSRVQGSVVLGQLQLKKLNYDQLTLVLRNNGLAAVRVGELVNIVPVATIRQTALPLLMNADDSFGNEEWVTRVFRLEKAKAKMMVPILRPLLPQQGHLVAHPESETLIMVDRYGNTQRIAEIIRILDVAAVQQE